MFEFIFDTPKITTKCDYLTKIAVSRETKMVIIIQGTIYQYIDNVNIFILTAGKKIVLLIWH